MKFIKKRAWIALLLMPVFFSCATYHKSMESYYSSVEAKNYDKALQKLGRNKFIKRNRNQLLYFLESGKMYRLKKDYSTSNRYLNQADDFIESTKKSAGDLVVGNLLNPMQQTYRGEDFELFMVHYYKALNYVALGEVNEALVEARRITLSVDAQGTKFRNSDKRYSSDAFALNLQGMLYELGGDINNAFIAYRNAADVYLQNNNNYYGVQFPGQLKKDLLRTAAIMGFSGEVSHYENLLNTGFKQESAKPSELILFIEEGRAPVKEENNFVLTNAGGTIGNFIYADQNGGQLNVPFNYNSYGISESKLSAVRAVRVAMPVYRIMYPQRENNQVSVNGKVYTPELAQDINSIAVNILKERFLAELGNALARQLTKQLLEKGAAAAARGIAGSQDKKAPDNASQEEKEKQSRKNKENAEAAGEIAGLLVNIFNTVSEKADTRNWQSLPAYVSYVRIPLEAGENVIRIDTNGNTRELVIQGNNKIQMMSIQLN